MPFPLTDLKSKRLAPAYSVLVIGFALSVALAFWAHREINGRANDAFKAEMRVNFEIIGNGVLRYLDAIRSAKSYVQSHPNATSADWNTYIDGQEWRHKLPALLDLGYAEAKPDKGTNIVIRYVTSRSSILHDVGISAFTNAHYLTARNQARDTGFPFATSVVGLGTNIVGQVLFLANYDDLDSPGLDDRRAAFKGFAFGSVDPEQLWNDVLAKTDRGPISIALAGTDRALQLAKSSEPLRRTVRYGTWGQQWPLLCVAKTPLIDPAARRLPGLIAALGGAISIILFGLIALQSHRRLQAEDAKAKTEKEKHLLEQQVAQRTRELQITNQQLQQALAKERELNEMKSSFVSTVSHEFRTPLGIVVSSAEILECYLDRLSATERAEHLSSIKTSAAQMTELMESVLEFSKVEAKMSNFDSSVIDIDSLCHRIVDEVESSTNVTCPIRLRLDGKIGTLCSNENVLRTILINVLTNAVKYSQPGGEVDFRVARTERALSFVIEDHGIGIPKEELPKLLVPFQRGSNTNGRPGTGLGLALVKRCVDLHGGRLELQSEEGKGTTVTITLPTTALTTGLSTKA
jgi:signal transduction histidine kinase